MLSKILKKLFSNKTKDGSATKQSIKDTNAITVIVEDNEPYIHIAITDLSTDKAISFGKMLSDLTNGYYVSSITEILLQLAKNDTSINVFVGQVLAGWSLQNKMNNSNTDIDNPIIKPTDFIKSIKNE